MTSARGLSIVATMVLCSALLLGSGGCFLSSESKYPSMACNEPAPIYTCRMHSEVLSARPATCPKCNMELFASQH